MKIVIRKRSSLLSRWKIDKTIDAGNHCGKKIILTPAAHALELEMKLNGGISYSDAEAIHAKNGQYRAPIYRVNAVNDSGKSIF
jgi:hypothetical protein